MANTSSLTQPYKDALEGLKAQAGVVTASLEAAMDRDALCRAQRKMAANRAECSHIVRLVMHHKVSVPDVTEEMLAFWLAYS